MLKMFTFFSNQPKYKFLQKVLYVRPRVGYFRFTENDQVVHPNDVKSTKQNNIRNYFTMGIHKNVDVFYLCQTYSRVPKQLIRDNTNLIVFFKQDDMHLRYIVYSDHVNTDMT